MLINFQRQRRQHADVALAMLPSISFSETLRMFSSRLKANTFSCAICLEDYSNQQVSLMGHGCVFFITFYDRDK